MIHECEYIREVTPEDIQIVGEGLRPIDLAELRIGGNKQDTRDVLAECVDLSRECYTALHPVKRTPVALFGLGGMPLRCDNIDYYPVWLLATKELTNDKVCRHAFIRYSRPFVQHFYEMRRPLGNTIWVKNTNSLRWLSWLGFAPAHVLRMQDNEMFILMVKD